ncbi:(R)-specific enoyl-CoA hydratase isoform X2 [Zea mays]|uniref:MaoC-like domain-containing protein n=1 Tax=Zea mays TaxID=4577 RepID=A0A804MIL7_MAIZE|nr:(R)-specific enoyl-CoA hydratase isoform X2 [Zea mays]
MRLRSRAIFPLVRTTAITTSAVSSPPAVLSVGHALRERRRFTEDDVAAYAAVSGDRNPVHLDDAVARELSGFQRGRVVHGMLVASLFPSVIAASFPGAVYASQTLKFAAPVYVGDEVVARVKALNIRMIASSSQPNASWTKRRAWLQSKAKQWLSCLHWSSALSRLATNSGLEPGD